MSKVHFKRTEIEFTLYDDTVIKCLRPTVKELEKVYEKLAGIDANEARGAWCDFMVSLGWTKEALDALEPEHFVEVIQEMTGTKKKSPSTSSDN